MVDSFNERDPCLLDKVKYVSFIDNAQKMVKP